MRRNETLEVPKITDGSSQMLSDRKIKSYLQATIQDYDQKQLSKRNLLVRPDSGKSPISERQQNSGESKKYFNPLSDEKDKGILQKSIRYKIGKTIMASS